jgi:hypothetical protein
MNFSTKRWNFRRKYEILVAFFQVQEQLTVARHILSFSTAWTHTKAFEEKRNKKKSKKRFQLLETISVALHLHDFSRFYFVSSLPGVDVMITIFGDFRQFSAKKLAFFSKTNVMIKFLHILALFWVKNANFFTEFIGENIFKNHNIGP